VSARRVFLRRAWRESCPWVRTLPPGQKSEGPRERIPFRAYAVAARSGMSLRALREAFGVK